jgi:hypothetical protein
VPSNVRVNTPICRPGETQKCVGPGACAGGQACKDDGSGFGPCDCADTTKDRVPAVVDRDGGAK